MDSIAKFVRLLSGYEDASPKIFNPYQNERQRYNLRLYLQMMTTLAPRFLLVGEALGYKGGAVTGVPFTSETILREQRPFNEYPFQVNNQQKEATATIFWQTLNKMDICPLCWNAFPFHPHQFGLVNSNRRPTKKELLVGRPFILQLMQLFGIEKVVTVGRVAQTSLASLPNPISAVRHPAYGGKQAFVQGLQTVFC